eukprot:6186183-Pleurochrysis_carterae.AAC.1
MTDGSSCRSPDAGMYLREGAHAIRDASTCLCAGCTRRKSTIADAHAKYGGSMCACMCACAHEHTRARLVRGRSRSYKERGTGSKRDKLRGASGQEFGVKLGSRGVLSDGKNSSTPTESANITACRAGACRRGYSTLALIASRHTCLDVLAPLHQCTADGAQDGRDAGARSGVSERQAHMARWYLLPEPPSVPPTLTRRTA